MLHADTRRWTPIGFDARREAPVTRPHAAVHESLTDPARFVHGRVEPCAGPAAQAPASKPIDTEWTHSSCYAMKSCHEAANTHLAFFAIFAIFVVFVVAFSHHAGVG